MTKERRNELETLSLKTYGSKSRYKSLMNKGYKLNGKWHFPTEEEIEAQMKKLTEGRSDKTIEQALAELTQTVANPQTNA